MQWSLEALVSWEQRVVVLCIEGMLMPTDWAWIEAIGLGYLARFPNTCTYMVMVTVLWEQWHSETMTFHLPTGEMTMTLKNVYHIFRLPVQGMPVTTTRDMINDVAV